MPIEMPSEQKNIVMILSDQHHAGVAGHAGDPWIRTPALDRLSQEGITFDSAYCASPLCVPSRSALLSGVHTEENECLTNDTALRSDRATFVHALSCAEYNTVLCGRMHFVGCDQRHGFRKRLVGDITPMFPGAKRADYGVLDGTSGQNLQSIKLSGPGNSNVIEYDRSVTDAACRFLCNEGKRATEPEPFFLCIGFYGPHCPFVCPPDLFYDYYSRVEKPYVPEGFLDDVHPAVQKWCVNRDVKKATADDVRRCRAAYYGLVELVDRNVGKIVESLDNSSLRENTIIVYTSDHGDMIGENGLFWKSNLYEGSVRVPLTFTSSGFFPAGRRSSSPVSLLDLAPTFISLARADELPEYHGVDLSPVLLGKRRADSERAVVSICTEAAGRQASAMIRKGKWKLVEHYGFADPQFFDLQRDPAEQNDRGAEPSATSIQRDLHRQLTEVVDLERVNNKLQKLTGHSAMLRRFGVSYTSDIPCVKETWFPEVNPNYLEPMK